VDKACLDCDATVRFLEPGDATCPNCGLPMFLTEVGQVGRYLRPGSDPGGFQRRRPPVRVKVLAFAHAPSGLLHAGLMSASTWRRSHKPKVCR
jgi:hypothetical protein